MSQHKLAREVFEIVLRATEHEDDKANRLLFAMAFLTAAASGFYSQVKGVPAQSVVLGRSLDTTTLTFVAFLVMVVIGTVLMLAALGPKFNLIEGWRKPIRTAEDAKDGSLYFFEAIARTEYSRWLEMWNDPNIEDVATSHLINEAFLIAKKTQYKVAMMSVGRSFYKLSLGALVMFSSVALTGETGRGLALGFSVVSGLALESVVEIALQPDGFGGRLFLKALDVRRKPVTAVSTVAWLTAFCTSCGGGIWWLLN